MVEQFIGIGIGINHLIGFQYRFPGEQAVYIIGRCLAFDVRHHFVHFLVGNKRALQTGRLGAAGLQEQQIAVFQQIFGTHLVENGAAVDFTLYGKRHAGGDVGFNQAGNHIYARALGGDNQVDTGGARFLCQAGNLLFH